MRKLLVTKISIIAVTTVASIIAVTTCSTCSVLEFGPDQGLQGQVVDIVRMLLDPDSMDQSPEKDPFLELFYDKYVGELINLLIEGAEQNQQQSQERLDAFRRLEQVGPAPPHTLSLSVLSSSSAFSSSCIDVVETVGLRTSHTLAPSQASKQ